MTLAEINRIENLKAGDLLTSDRTDPVIVLDNSYGLCDVVECDYSEEKQEYVKSDRKRRLTYREIARDFDI